MKSSNTPENLRKQNATKLGNWEIFTRISWRKQRAYTILNRESIDSAYDKLVDEMSCRVKKARKVVHAVKK